MRKWIIGAALSSAVLFTVSCSGNKQSEKVRIEYDTLPATQITVAAEYFLEGTFFCKADSAFLSERTTGLDWPVSRDGVYAQIKVLHDSLKRAGEDMYGRFYGVFLPKFPGVGGELVLRLTQWLGLEKQPKSGVLTGTYRTEDGSLLLRPDHTYLLFTGEREKEGKWYLTTADVLVLSMDGKHSLLDVDEAGGLLKMRGGEKKIYKR